MFSFPTFFNFFFSVMLPFQLQNIEGGKAYDLVMYVKSTQSLELTVQLTSSDGLQTLASATITLVYFLLVFRQEKIFLLFTITDSIALL